MRHLTRQGTGLATTLGLGLLAVAPLLAAPAPASAQSVQTSGTLVVAGGSTVRSWDCETEDLRFDIQLSDAGLSMDALDEAVSAMVLQVPTAALACGDDTMDRHMWDALETEDHPWVVFRMQSYTATPGDEGVDLVLSGTLEIADEVREVQVAVTALATENGVRVRGTHELDMTEWGIRPPRLMLGTLRVRDDVEIHIDVTLTPGG